MLQALFQMTEDIVIIRQANENDHNAIRTLVPELVAFGPPPWRDSEAMSRTDLEVIEETLRSTGADPAIYVAEIGSTVAGFIHVRSATDYYTRAAHGHVADLVVNQEFRGRGVAQHLLERAEQWARQLGFVWLTIAVFEENVNATRIYERAGFHREVIRLIKPLTA